MQLGITAGADASQPVLTLGGLAAPLVVSEASTRSKNPALCSKAPEVVQHKHLGGTQHMMPAWTCAGGASLDLPVRGNKQCTGTGATSNTSVVPVWGALPLSIML
ncbi:hypothetical protein NDU88_010839 [Pleurodeles waltl]|uniref:Uncharacterized protein n=1 Tax=Pleurodeles waltl TaxID=8319 RepID=A0AAV7QVU8_PLEWA|nr:hypothetical protein NDU88_010839 [Pleurodeles waltl]